MPEQSDIIRLGTQLHDQTQGEIPGFFDKNYWFGKVLDWVMKDPSFKRDLFHFVDVLPTLKSSEQVAKHINEYLLKKDRQLPTVIDTALRVATFGVTSSLGAKAIKKNVEQIAARFIVGQNPQAAAPILKKLFSDGIGFTADLLGEATLSEGDAQLYQKRYLELIEHVAQETKNWPKNSILNQGPFGHIPTANVSLKITAMDSQLTCVDPAGGVKRLLDKVLPIFYQAKKLNTFINIDLEQWSNHEITYNLLKELVQDPELKDWPHIGIVIQAYLPTAINDLEFVSQLARDRGAPLTVRLVKGAYWDYEVVNARQHGYACPVFVHKNQSDENFEKITWELLKKSDHLQAAFGSHNLRSVSYALACAEELKLPKNSYEIQMLYGMAEPERKALSSMGHRVRIYAPIGDMLPGMAYLVRRLLENTANSGFLRMSYEAHESLATLLKSPALSA